MAISPIRANMAYTTPSFKGVPKMNAGSVSRVVSAVTENAPKNTGILEGIKNTWNKAYDGFVEKALVKPILAPLMNSEAIGKFAEKSKNIDNMAAHMSTAGSIVTTATYAGTSLKTLRKDEDQKKRAKTLALNQVMVTGLSTLGAYTINDKLGKMSKQLGYKFREANQGNPKLSTRMKGFNTAKSLLIFSVMYRYVAPVLVTPLASKIGNYVFNDKKEADKAATTDKAPAQQQAPAQSTTTVATK